MSTVNGPEVGACDLADELRAVAIRFAEQHPGFTVQNALAAVRIVEGLYLHALQENRNGGGVMATGKARDRRKWNS